MSNYADRPRLYFAYGSNLNQNDWHAWCKRKKFPTGLLKFHSCGYLPDWDIRFDHRSSSRGGGTLNIHPRVGQAVPGVIFEVDDLGWKALDKKEDSPDSYRWFETMVQDQRGQLLRVGTYRAHGGDIHVRPAAGYCDLVGEALEQYGHHTNLLDAAAEGEETPWITDAVFCYGTLMRGESRFPILKRLDPSCILLAETWGRLLDLGSFPGLIEPGAADQLVQGEFVRVNNFGQLFPVLDSVEGFYGYEHASSLFHRVLVPVGVGEGRVRLAWVYVHGRSQEPVQEIRSGDWREHCGIRDQLLNRVIEAHAEYVGGLAKLDSRLRALDTWHDRPETMSPFESLKRRDLSERRLAQASGSWTVLS